MDMSHAHCHCAARIFDPDEPPHFHLVVEPQKPLAGDQKVPGVFKEVEPHQVGTENASKKLVPDRQSAEDFGGREGDVEEQPDVGLPDAARDQLGHKEKWIVLHEDQIVLVCVGCQRICEQFVDALVGRPLCVVESLPRLCIHGQHVVEERPQAPSEKGEELIELLLVRRKHPHTAHLLKSGGCLCLVALSRTMDTGKPDKLHRHPHAVPQSKQG
mmetsp:Transcript_54245/g.106132  ORF Transcript_54245/g.106132 Transcript_54245/m.106132 type:complete len:215 (-) Transcript_54245:118-762(-)